jgi:hypothetical protein
MPKIPKEYPTELPDDELLRLIRDYTIEATVAGRPSNYVTGPGYWKEMSDLGQNEISNRIQKRLLVEISNLKEEISILKKDNKRSGFINRILSFLTICLAFITIYIGYQSLSIAKSDKADIKSKQAAEMIIFQENNRTLQLIYNELKDIDKQNNKEDTK